MYFISDVHLALHDSSSEDNKRRAFLTFLDRVHQENAELFIVGDLFDFWFEWRHVVPRYWFPILHKLAAMVKDGCPVHLMKGNHDFAPGPYLREKVGLDCLEDTHTFIRSGKRFFLAHGDGLARQDRGYRLLKKIIRRPVSIALFRYLIPADIGMSLAKWISRSSRRLKPENKERWGKEYLAFAREKFSQGYDYVILGHLHAPVRVEENGHTYLNCGDWINEFTFGIFDGTSLRLERLSF